jgi:hypothetical protein
MAVNVIEWPTARFDGRTFLRHDDMAPYLYLAYKARRGDGLAAELLAAFAVTVYDAEGREYWPMEPEPDAVVTSPKA